MKVMVSHAKSGKKKTVLCPLGIMNNPTDCAAFFRKLGRREKEGCEILFEGWGQEKGDFASSGESLPVQAKMLRLAAASVYDGAYCFSKEALRDLNTGEIFQKRDLLSDFGKGEFTFILPGFGEEQNAAITEGALQGTIRGYARTLGNLPNNYLHTEDLADYARELGEDLGISCQILGDQDLKDLGCGGLLAVNQGSCREAAMVVLQYKGGGDESPVALVGKGLMFDSGGYHLKTIDGMKGMKYDMCGAAGALEALELLVRKKVRKNLIAVLLLSENVISPDALKMGDVITTLAGKTVEVYNTDAEGRLVLADGITYVQNLGASLVIDIATLTYSAQAALGDAVTGLFSNEDETYRHWMEAAGRTGEKFWRLPLDGSYHKLLEWSICADFANYAPGKGAGASVAACFLEKFINQGTRWLHLDMVGPSVIRSQTDEMAEGASGAGIYTIAEFIDAFGVKKQVSA